MPSPRDLPSPLVFLPDIPFPCRVILPYRTPAAVPGADPPIGDGLSPHRTRRSRHRATSPIIPDTPLFFVAMAAGAVQRCLFEVHSPRRLIDRFYSEIPSIPHAACSIRPPINNIPLLPPVGLTSLSPNVAESPSGWLRHQARWAITSTIPDGHIPSHLDEIFPTPHASGASASQYHPFQELLPPVYGPSQSLLTIRTLTTSEAWWVHSACRGQARRQHSSERNQTSTSTRK